MLIIEYINVRTKEKWSKHLQKSNFLQLFISVTLGALPGCAGIFAVVSLYSHNLISFTSLLSSSIAAVGDEAFIMLTLIPQEALKLFAILIALSLITGVVLNVIYKKNIKKKFEEHLKMHGDDCCAKGKLEHHSHQHEKKYGFTFARSMFLAILILILFSQFVNFENITEHSHEHELFSPETIIFFIMGIVSMFIVITVPEHFLTEHLWAHVLKKHFAKLFLWTIGTLLIVSFTNQFLPLEQWIKSNPLIIFLLALGIGTLPTSGPHVIFITLFSQGLIPFSFLLSNSVVQEGHAGIPLLAEDKMSFVKIKIIKIIIAIILGTTGFLLKF